MKEEDIFERLYGRSPWLPIVCLGWKSGAIAWVPGGDKGGNEHLLMRPCDRIGAWGGCVETYAKGFNCQPVDTVFAALDVDQKKGANEHIKDVPARCAELLPEAMVRRSTSGRGAHIFIILEAPVRVPNKRVAQRLAHQIALPFSQRLELAGVEVDIVGHNQLWVTGGQQLTIQEGVPVTPPQLVDADSPVAPLPAEGDGTSPLTLDDVGEVCREVLHGLIAKRIISLRNGSLSAKYKVHIKPTLEVLDAMCCRVPHQVVESAGTDLAHPNAILSIEPTTLTLYSFVGAKKIFQLPLYA